MDTLDYASEELGVSRDELAEALRRGRIRAEREERRRNDGAIEYQPVTGDFSLFQAIKAGYVSRLVLKLSVPKPWHWRVHGTRLTSVIDSFSEAVNLADRWEQAGLPVEIHPSDKLGLHL